MEQEQMMMQEQAEMGRSTDTVLAHLSLGEVVIPRAFLDDPEVMQVLQMMFEAAGANMAEFTVGDPANKINPETGHPEFFFKKLKRIFKAVAPIALSYFGTPALGTALGGGLGGSIGAGALLGGAGSALTGGNVLQGAALGGAGGALNSAVSGGLQGTAVGRAVDSIGTGIGDAIRGVGLGDILGSSADSVTLPGIGSVGMNNGTGIKGFIGSALPGSSPTQGAVQGAGVGAAPSAYGGSLGGQIIGGIAQAGAQDKASKQLLEQQRAAMAMFQPYANPQFTEQDFRADPGYEFRLQEGQRALERSQAARGGLFSGQAMREAQEVGQGLANQTYQDAYNRWLQEQQQGVGVAGNMAGLAQGIGNIKAQNTQGLSNTFANTLSQALGGSSIGANNAGRTFVGYDAQGNPIYR
jgi:hypothetical protein